MVQYCSVIYRASECNTANCTLYLEYDFIPACLLNINSSVVTFLYPEFGFPRPGSTTSVLFMGRRSPADIIIYIVLTVMNTCSTALVFSYTTKLWNGESACHTFALKSVVVAPVSVWEPHTLFLFFSATYHPQCISL